MSESIGILDNWDQTETSRFSGASADLFTPNLSTLAQPTLQLLKTSSDFIRILQALSVEGPLILSHHLIEEYFIGAGGQFSVYQNWVGGQNLTVPWDLSPAAVKRCKIVLGRDQEVDLTSEETRRQVHDMFLEVLVLRNPVLKSHRNIVHLLGWSFETGYNGMPLLVMELATEGNLRQLLSEKIKSDDWDIMHHLCLDMAAGLDAIHGVGIIHADFKPENVLVFRNESEDVPFIAKLSDFGYSVPEAEAQNESKIYVTALSNGWQAPEIRLTQPPMGITTNDYKKADLYSLGMAIWSTWCFRGRPPIANDPANALEEASEMVAGLLTLSETQRSTLSSALCHLLRFEPAQRPEDALELLKDGSQASRQWEMDQAPQSEFEQTVSKGKNAAHSLQIPPIQQFSFLGSTKAFEEYGSSMTGGELFSLFLKSTYYAIPSLPLTIHSTAIKQLLLAAERGFVPAQAVVNMVLQSCEIEWPPEYVKYREKWLFEGAAIGCPIATNDPLLLGESAEERARSEFRERGGYQQYYYSDIKRAVWRKWKDENVGSDGILAQVRIEELVISDHEEEKPSEPHKLTCRDSLEDKPLPKWELLYLSCLAGDTQAVLKLCDAGVDASVIGEPAGATCLHWLSAFPPDDMKVVLAVLINSGASLEKAVSETRQLVPNHTYPYSWPPGTALHWAVTISNQHAVRALIQQGADLYHRNGYDPYMYDLDVRYLEYEGEDESQGSFSVPTGECLGMSPFDLAVSFRNTAVLDIILEIKGPVALKFEADEEGYTPFHRLQYNHIGRTSTQHRYDSAVFQGPREKRRNGISDVVRLLKNMGGDINSLTKPSSHNMRLKDRPGALTLLMMAVRAIDLDAVMALLDHGADPNVRNNLGYSVLSQLPEANDPHYNFSSLPLIVDLLIRSGADITAPDAYSGYTPLACAVLCGDVNIMELLLKAGANPTEKHKTLGVMAWWVAEPTVYEYNGYWKSQAPWLERDARIVSILTNLVFSKPSEVVNRIINDVDEYGSTLLHYAALSGQPGVVRAVLDAGVDRDVKRGEEEKPTDFGMNFVSKRWFVPGTALDACRAMRDRVLVVSRRGTEHISPEEYRFMLSIYDEVERILVADGEGDDAES